MGRKKESFVHNFFKADLITGKQICQIGSCGVQLASDHAKNLERHLESIHHDTYLIVKKENENRLANKRNSLAKIEFSEPELKKRKRPSEVKDSGKNSQKIAQKKTLTKTDLLNACVELVTVNGRPFEMIEDTGFRKIIDPIILNLNELNPNEPLFSINKHNISFEVSAKAEQVENDIRDMVKNRLLSLKIDGVARKDKAVVGVHVQFSHCGKTKLKTLGMFEVTEQYTGVYLKQKVCEVLEKFSIQAEQILTISIDNAKNLIGTNKTDCEDDVRNNDSEIRKEYPEDQQDLEIETILEVMEQELISGMDICAAHELPFLNYSQKPKSLATQIRCSARTLELCIEDTLNEKSILNLISKAREVMDKFIVPKFMDILEKANLNNIAVQDVETRWLSSYDTLEKCLLLNEACGILSSSYPDFEISDTDWEAIKHVLACLQPAKVATIRLQKDELTLGDFYAVWVKCYSETKKIDSSICQNICTVMETSQEAFMSNVVFLSAIFLDPRFQCMLDDMNKSLAKQYIVQTWCIMVWLENKDNENTNRNLGSTAVGSVAQQPPPVPSQQYDDGGGGEDDDTLEDFIKNVTAVELHERLEYANMPSQKSQETLIRDKLDYQDNCIRLHHSTDVRKYWDDNKLDKPELFKIAQVFMSVPATQVSVERCFSGLKYICSDQRASLTKEMLETILIVRSNRPF